jgi:hypothetical protein
MHRASYPPGSVEAIIREHGGPIYGADPDQPGFFIRENADGSRERGLLIGRQFVSIGPYEKTRKQN